MKQRVRETDLRPDPEALLTLADQGRRGRLTIFLGAAPGVGKTFAMLTRAQRLRESGLDIVVGLVETHGRPDTEQLLSDLELLARRKIEYHGRNIPEFDLDGALVRNPKILIVDELAHTNAPGSRHPKRYQDIEELLQSGIDVWTAVNVQHLENLADVVTQITGVLIRELVPDRIIDAADDIILIDLPPSELIDRLKQGKVYVPDIAKRAQDKFFRLGNLTALRELALRRTADRVDDQMIDYLQQNAIEGQWPTTERLLVCISDRASSEAIIRTASRLAQSLNAPWTAAHVERPDRPILAEAAAQLDENLRLAERLGAQTKRLVGSDFVSEILKFAKREHATQIVIGNEGPRFISRLWQPSLIDALMNNRDGVNVHIVNNAQEAKHQLPKSDVWRFSHLLKVQPLTVPLLSVGIATLAGLALSSALPLPNVSLLYLLAVVISAIYQGYRAAIIAAAFSAILYNFAFIQPIGTLTIAAPHEVFAFFVFIAAAVLAGGIASQVQQQRSSALARARTTERLFSLSSKLSAASREEDVLWVGANQLSSILNRQIVFYLPTDGELVLFSSWPPDEVPQSIDGAAARWAFEKNESAGAGTATLPASVYQFTPLRNHSGVIGVCGFRFEHQMIGADELRSFEAAVHQIALAIDRARLSKVALKQAANLAGDQFRAALLSSISHDLKTPLATITGAASSLKEFGETIPIQSRKDLLISIEEEAERLTRYVNNLLDMTRIDAGAVSPKPDWIDVNDIIHQTISRVERLFFKKQIEAKLAIDLPLIKNDGILLGQALFNILDNAVKYGGGTPITVYARREKNGVVISVTDLGTGISAKDKGHIFDKFSRSTQKSDGRKTGTGLGLSIARGFIEAMCGSIYVESPAVKKRGTRFIIHLPINEHHTAKDRNR